MADSNNDILWSILKVIHDCAKRRSELWVPWFDVGGKLQVDPDLLAAMFDHPSLKQFVRQNKSGRLVSLTPNAHKAVLEPIEHFEWIVPVKPRTCWVYYSHFVAASVDPLRLVLHDQDCPHCNSGGGHGGDKPQRVEPEEVALRIPNTAWIGPFPSPSSAINWCETHPRIRVAPDRCSHCFTLQ